MFSNIIKQVQIDTIIIDRKSRQRTELTLDSVLSLAVSIAKSQWISPILIDEETNYLVAGERRLMAVKALRNAVNGIYDGFANELTAQNTLSPICTCNVDSWNQWQKIPAQLGRSFTQTDLVMYEFIENAHRRDLSWQDRARAVYDAHCKGLTQDKSWTGVHTADLLGLHRSAVTENLRIWRIFADEDADQELKSIIAEAPTLKSAAQTIERYNSRRDPGLGISLMSAGSVTHAVRPKADTLLYSKPGPCPLTDVNKPKEIEIGLEDDFDFDKDVKFSERSLINADFIKWAAEYTGEPFNFIHCDFPYGINFNTGPFTATISNKILGEYDDSADVYWNLLEALKLNRDRLLAPQCHIMFWFSQNNRRETEDFFVSMGAVVQPFLMIWHSAEGDGIVPDPQRYGRRTYETAMLITFGDRKIVAPRQLSVSASREAKTRIHRSQKPLRVLEHFFEMFVDKSSSMLDPTAGSGTSLIAASNLLANRIVGLEADEEIYRKSCNFIDNAVISL